MIRERMPSRAKNYYDDLIKGGAARRLQAFVAAKAEEKRFEDDWLEYKSGDDVNKYLMALRKSPEWRALATVQNSEEGEKQQGSWKDKLPKVWAKYLSAFANNEGGVVVWGLEVAPIPNAAGDKVDAPVSLRPVNELEAAKTALTTLANEATDPPIAGIEHRRVPLKRGGDSGFLISYIPPSMFKPYRAEFGLKQFFFRSGASSNVATPSVVRMLCTAYKAHRVTALLQHDRQQGTVLHHYSLVLRSDSIASIRNPFVIIECEGAKISQQPTMEEVTVEGGQITYRSPKTMNMREQRHIRIALYNDVASEVQDVKWTIILSIEDYFPLRAEFTTTFPYFTRRYETLVPDYEETGGTQPTE